MLKSRVLRVLRVMVFLPVAVFLWMIGWTLTWVGSRKEANAERCRDVPVTLQSDDDAVWIGTSEESYSILNDDRD